MEDQMAAIRITFFQECEEQLSALQSGLISIERGDFNQETINAVFRAVHSIKGGAGIFSLEQLVKFSHVFETALDKLRSGSIDINQGIISLFFRAADLMEDIVNCSKENKLVTESRVDETIKLFDSIDNIEQDKPKNALKIWKIFFKPFPSLYQKANESVFLLREVESLGNTEVILNKNDVPGLLEIDPEGAYFSWDIKLESDCSEQDIRNIFDFVEGDCTLEISLQQTEDIFLPGTVITGENGFKFEFFGPADPEFTNETENNETIQQESSKLNPVLVELPLSNSKHKDTDSSVPKKDIEQQASKNSASTTIRVDLDRVDRMINLVGELVINEAMLSQCIIDSGLNQNSNIALATEMLENLTREIQDSVMAIRAQPVRSVFQRMPRLVRELETITGKQVHLICEGEATEVDKTIIERISDPLTHMIRNAIDHGIELPDTRIAEGKPAQGVLRLTASHKSGRIVLEVEDDGAGINRSRVYQKAIDNGLISKDLKLADEEIDNLIFLPGFSTAEQISDISGRGVGMDVVRQSVQEMGGKISILSKPGIGSKFTLSMPLTLAVLDGMVISSHGHILIIPLNSIVETLKPNSKDIFNFDKQLNMIHLRGGYVPIIDVAHSLGYSVDHIKPESGVGLLVENDEKTRAVLLVDAIHGQRQVVIKSLESNYKAVPGISAATVMGDGRIALILDIDTVLKNIVFGTKKTNEKHINLILDGKAA